MSTLRGLLGCVSDRSHEYKIKFGVPLSEALNNDNLPIPLVDLLIYIAQEGVTTTDLFRRPGNTNDAKMIMKSLAEGKRINLTNYNFYTLATVVKKFLLKIPGGVFGEAVEVKLLQVLNLQQRLDQYEEFFEIITTLPPATQQLLALLFGTWFRIVNHAEFNNMSSEAVAKSVAGSVFHTCADDPRKVEEAVQVLQILIDDFGVANLFGRKNLQYFADMTHMGVRVREKFKFEYQYPKQGSATYEESVQYFALVLQQEAQKCGFDPVKDAISEDEFYGGNHGVANSPPSPQSLLQAPGNSSDNPHKKLANVTSISAPEVNKGYSPTNEHLTPNRMTYQSSSLSRFDNVRRRQLMRMKKRSNWFLSGSPGNANQSGMQEPLHVSNTMSDSVVSDTGILETPTPLSDRLSDGGGSLMESFLSSCNSDKRLSHSLGPFPYRHQPDLLNGNHTLASTSSSQGPSPRHSTPSPSPPVTNRDVRYFMVDNCYEAKRPPSTTASTDQSWDQPASEAALQLMNIISLLLLVFSSKPTVIPSLTGPGICPPTIALWKLCSPLHPKFCSMFVGFLISNDFHPRGQTSRFPSLQTKSLTAGDQQCLSDRPAGAARGGWLDDGVCWTTLQVLELQEETQSFQTVLHATCYRTIMYMSILQLGELLKDSGHVPSVFSLASYITATFSHLDSSFYSPYH